MFHWAIKFTSGLNVPPSFVTSARWEPHLCVCASPSDHWEFSTQFWCPIACPYSDPCPVFLMCPPPKKKKKHFFFLLKCMSHLSGFIIASDISLGSHCHFTQHCFGEICSWERPVPVPRIMSSVTSSPHINPGSSMYRDQSSPSWEKPQNASQILRDVNTTRSSLPTSVQTRPICLSTSAVDLLKFLAPPSGPTRKWRFLQPR